MRTSDLEHPDITRVMQNGYPDDDDVYYCEICEREVDPDDMYEDEQCEVLCKHCLLNLHAKGW